MPHLPGRPPSDADYTEFVHASWASLYRTAYHLLGDHAEAEDLTQTALAKTAAWHRVRGLNARSRVRPHLGRSKPRSTDEQGRSGWVR
jgi:DNA-directed RNA polymerase specialized sigma24 family protein